MNDNFEEEGSSETPTPVAAVALHADEIVVHQEPRISANKLAEYVIADPSRQRTILRDCKFARRVMVVHYKETRACVPHAFGESSFNIDVLVRRAQEIEGGNDAPELSDWQRNDNTNSALALRHLAAVAPELSWGKARRLHVRLGGLSIAGVQVSIQPELVFSFEHRSIPKVGAVILNTAKGADKSLERRNGAHCVGDYLSSLVFQVLLAKATKFGAPLNTRCYAVDVFRERVYTAPTSYRKLNKNLEAACEMIASRWKDIKPAA
jgi:hypothetical protein